MVNGILNFQQCEKPLHNLPVMAFSLRAARQEAIDDLASSAGNSGVTLALDIHPALPGILTGLPDKLKLILHHLLGNAIKFPPPSCG